MSNAELESERPLNTTELAEAFGLGSALAEIRTTLGFVRGTVEKTDSTVTDMSGRMGTMEVRQGEQAQQIHTLFQQIARVEDDVKTLRSAPGEQPSRAEFVELKDEVKSGRLSWTKVAALVAAIAVSLTVVGIVDAWTPGT
jgi:hypothetical protein